MGWILETNKNMNRAMEAMGGRVVRRFRMYERVVASSVHRHAAPAHALGFLMRRTDFLKASPPMFKSPWLDRFTRVHPAVPVLIYLPAIAALLLAGGARAGFLNSLGLVLGGYAVWTLTEYWLHRVVFHFEPERGIGARLHWMIHGVHHDHPNDPLRLVMPPSASVPLALFFCALFWVVLGGAYWMPFAAGFLAGYLAYDMIHYHVTITVRARASGASCASRTCATTSRTTSAASASARRTGTASSAPRRSVAHAESRLPAGMTSISSVTIRRVSQRQTAMTTERSSTASPSPPARRRAGACAARAGPGRARRRAGGHRLRRGAATAAVVSRRRAPRRAAGAARRGWWARSSRATPSSSTST